MPPLSLPLLLPPSLVLMLPSTIGASRTWKVDCSAMSCALVISPRCVVVRGGSLVSCCDVCVALFACNVPSMHATHLNLLDRRSKLFGLAVQVGPLGDDAACRLQLGLLGHGVVAQVDGLGLRRTRQMGLVSGVAKCNARQWGTMATLASPTAAGTLPSTPASACRCHTRFRTTTTPGEG